MDRIMGVLTLKSPVYRQIAEDQSATKTAAIIVAVVAVLTGVVGAVVVGTIGSQLPAGVGVSSNPIGYAIQAILLSFLGWGIGSWVMGFVGNMLGGKTNTGEMLRVFGYASIFNLLGIIPCLGFVGWILGIIATVIGIREAAEVSTGKALVIGVVGFIAVIIVSTIIGAILGAIGLGSAGFVGQ
jgi:hypothetical protein